MGEAGPEAIMPLTRGPDGNLGVRASGGGNSIGDVHMHFNIDATGADSGTLARLQSAVSSIATNLKPAAVAAVREAMLKNRASPAF
jgi:phage-related minor tail protein